MGWPVTEAEARSEERWTQELLAVTRDVRCPACKAEVVRTGGVVGACDEHRRKR